MERRQLTARRDPNLSLLCNICGDTPRGNNLLYYHVFLVNHFSDDMDYSNLYVDLHL